MFMKNTLDNATQTYPQNETFKECQQRFQAFLESYKKNESAVGDMVENLVENVNETVEADVTQNVNENENVNDNMVAEVVKKDSVIPNVEMHSDKENVINNEVYVAGILQNLEFIENTSKVMEMSQNERMNVTPISSFDGSFWIEPESHFDEGKTKVCDEREIMDVENLVEGVGEKVEGKNVKDVVEEDKTPDVKKIASSYLQDGPNWNLGISSEEEEEQKKEEAEKKGKTRW